MSPGRTRQQPPHTGERPAQPAPLGPEDIAELLTDRLGEQVRATDVAWGQLTVTVDADGYVAAARLCRDEPQLDMDFFDCISGVDEREDGFAVVAILYSTTHHHRVLLRHLCEGGRNRPRAPSLTPLYRGAEWQEREAFDMFGIEFDGHPGLTPRILTSENFEGWPLRKDFHLATREAKPWPGIKEPRELDEDGQLVELTHKREAGEASGPTTPDEAMAEQARRAAGLAEEVDPPEAAGAQASGQVDPARPDARAERARRKARELRARKRAERDGDTSGVDPSPGDHPPQEDRK